MSERGRATVLIASRAPGMSRRTRFVYNRNQSDFVLSPARMSSCTLDVIYGHVWQNTTHHVRTLRILTSKYEQRRYPPTRYTLVINPPRMHIYHKTFNFPSLWSPLFYGELSCQYSSAIDGDIGCFECVNCTCRKLTKMVAGCVEV